MSEVVCSWRDAVWDYYIMIYKIILVVGTLAVLCSTKVLEDVDKNTTTTANITTDLPATTGSPVIRTEKGSGVPCKVGGVDGVCVLQIHCNEIIHAKIENTSRELVADRICLSNSEQCCLQLESRHSVTPINKTNERKECGWRNFGGLVPSNSTDALNTSIKGETTYTEFGELPWMVAILKVVPVNESEPDSPKTEKYVGGGSLIHPRAVLTAAHYVENNDTFRVRAGEWDTQNINEIYPHQDRDVSSIEIHKDFYKNTLFYDIAILFLSEPMELAPNVGLACLPPPRERVAGGTQCVASGWGKDKFGKDGQYQVILKKVEVPVVQRQQCQTALRQTRLGNLFQLHSSFMCAGAEVGIDTCIGDGGSPLMCPIETEPGRYMQSGIVAWGIGCGQDGNPGVYVDVSNLRNWVDDKIAGRGLDPKVYTY